MSILPTIEWFFFCNFVCWLGTCAYALNQDAQTCWKVKALLEMDQSVHYLLHTRISWHVCVICEEPASDITATVVWGGIPQVFPVECWSWHLLSRWILSWAGIHYLSLGWEWILTTPSLLECSLRRNHRIQVWMLYPPSFYFGVCNSWDHDRVTGTTACTRSNMHALVHAFSVISSSSVCLS